MVGINFDVDKELNIVDWKVLGAQTNNYNNG